MRHHFEAVAEAAGVADKQRTSPEKVVTMALKVLFIGGYTRSGSTFLSRILGRGEGFFDVGELRNIWKKGFGRGDPCGCGKDFRECGFWTDVIHRAFGGFDHVDWKRVLSLKQTVERPRRASFLVRPFLRNAAYQQSLREYGKMLERILTAVQEVSSCRIVIDSSKTPEHATALGTSPEIELHVVHLIRDARATAYSWRRHKERLGPSGQVSQMHRNSYLTSARHWHRVNKATALLRDVASSFTLLRYEDFVREPREHCARILASLGESDSVDAILSDNVVELSPSHSIGGNPNKFDSGRIEIRVDNQWEREMSRWGRGVVTLATWRMLRSYGYIGAN